MILRGNFEIWQVVQCLMEEFCFGGVETLDTVRIFIFLESVSVRVKQRRMNQFEFRTLATVTHGHTQDVSTSSYSSFRQKDLTSRTCFGTKSWFPQVYNTFTINCRQCRQQWTDYRPRMDNTRLPKTAIYCKCIVNVGEKCWKTRVDMIEPTSCSETGPRGRIFLQKSRIRRRRNVLRMAVCYCCQISEFKLVHSPSST